MLGVVGRDRQTCVGKMSGNRDVLLSNSTCAGVETLSTNESR